MDLATGWPAAGKSSIFKKTAAGVESHDVCGSGSFFGFLWPSFFRGTGRPSKRKKQKRRKERKTEEEQEEGGRKRRRDREREEGRKPREAKGRQREDVPKASEAQGFELRVSNLGFRI